MTLFSSSRSNPGPAMTRWLSLSLLVVGLLLLAGCQASGNMDTQPYNRPLSASDFFANGSSARNIVAGTVPQTDQPANDPALTGLTPTGDPVTAFPVPVTNDLIKRGQERYGIFCAICHGVDGHGDGKVVVTYKFPKPHDLLASENKTLAIGKIFDIITNGQGNMLSYAYRVKAPDRWAVIAYLRAMQLKNGHLTQDLTPAELGQLGK